MKVPQLIDDAAAFLMELQDVLSREIDREIVTEELQTISDKLQITLLEFERQASMHYGDSLMVADASYLLCTFADERLANYFGLHWKKFSLLVKQHNDAHGGELSWKTLEKLLTLSPFAIKPAQTDLLSLYELVIKQGFQGRYQLMIDGDVQLKQIRDRVYSYLHGSELAGNYVRELVDLAHERHESQNRNRGIIIALGMALILACTLISIHFYLNMRWAEISSTF